MKLNKTFVWLLIIYIIALKLIQIYTLFFSNEYIKVRKSDQRPIFPYLFLGWSILLYFRFAYVSEANYARTLKSEREPVRHMIENIKLVLKSHIHQVKWMNSSHKSYAENKLKNMRIIVGAPDEMYNEESFDELLGLDNVIFLSCFYSKIMN